MTHILTVEATLSKRCQRSPTTWRDLGAASESRTSRPLTPLYSQLFWSRGSSSWAKHIRRILEELLSTEDRGAFVSTLTTDVSVSVTFHSSCRSFFISTDVNCLTFVLIFTESRCIVSPLVAVSRTNSLMEYISKLCVFGSQVGRHRRGEHHGCEEEGDGSAQQQHRCLRTHQR